MSKRVQTVKFDSWPEARDFIREMTEDVDSTYAQTDFYSYKDGSGYASLISEWDWAVINIEWKA